MRRAPPDTLRALAVADLVASAHSASSLVARTMAAGSFLALLDDVASVLDDVALMTKMAAQKSAGVLGDDLALNAEQVTGVKPDRELPVVWAVAKGSLINKLILVPAALLISAFLPWGVTVLLMIGGAYLCFEGCEKVLHKFLHAHDAQDPHQAHARAVADPSVDLVALEQDKIRGAIRTDFVLSAEIIAISLSVVASAPLLTRIGALAAIGVGMTIGVYGLVAGIVKLDDLGLRLKARKDSRAAQAVGGAILATAPMLMHGLSIAGTAAMFLVGGGIMVHGIEWLHHKSEEWTHHAAEVATVGPVLGFLVPMLVNAAVGFAVGIVIVGVVSLVGRLRGGKSAPAAH